MNAPGDPSSARGAATEGRRPLHPRRRANGARLVGLAFVATLLCLALIRPFVLEPFYIPSDSMAPLLHAGDRVFVNKLAWLWREPRRGEVVVFYGTESSGHPDWIYVKRIIGLPGETLIIRNGRTRVQGSQGAQDISAEWGSRPYAEFGPDRVPPGDYFVMGDNRNDSLDSRYWGPVPRERLIGRAVAVFWPLSHARWTR